MKVVIGIIMSVGLQELIIVSSETAGGEGMTLK